MSMETTRDTITFKRRSFFRRLFGVSVGGWIAGNLFSDIVHFTTGSKNKKAVQVTINPLAVPRTNKDITSYGA
jgi:hypothetical protein